MRGVVIEKNDALGVQLIHHRRGFLGVVDLAAAAHADDQHIGVAQQHPVGGCEFSSGGTEMGKAEAPLQPAPEGGVAKAASAHAVVGIGKALQAQAINAIRPGLGQKTAAGHVAGPFIGEFGVGQNNAGRQPRFRKPRSTTHGLVRVEQHRLAAPLDQQGPLPIAADRHSTSRQGRRHEAECQACSGGHGGTQDGHGRGRTCFGR